MSWHSNLIFDFLNKSSYRLFFFDSNCQLSSWTINQNLHFVIDILKYFCSTSCLKHCRSTFCFFVWLVVFRRTVRRKLKIWNNCDLIESDSDLMGPNRQNYFLYVFNFHQTAKKRLQESLITRSLVIGVVTGRFYKHWYHLVFNWSLFYDTLPLFFKTEFNVAILFP